MILVALLPSLVAAAIFVGTFRLRRGSKAPPRVVILPPRPGQGAALLTAPVQSARAA